MTPNVQTRTHRSTSLAKANAPVEFKAFLGYRFSGSMRHKFNPNHDDRGRFTSGPSTGGQLAQNTPEEEGRRGGGLFSDTYAETLQARMDLANARISRVAPGNSVLDGLRADGVPPDLEVVSAQEEAAQYLERMDTILKPNGTQLGQQGYDHTIRVITGGQSMLDNIVRQLTSNYARRDIPGGPSVYRVPGGYIGIRGPSYKSPNVTGTIDVSIPGMFVGKIKFKQDI